MTWIIMQEQGGSAEYNQVTLKGKQVSIPFEKIPFTGTWEIPTPSLKHNHYRANLDASIEISINGQTVQGSVRDLLVSYGSSSKILDVIDVKASRYNSGDSSEPEVSTELSAPVGTKAYIRIINQDSAMPLLLVQSNDGAKFEQVSGQIEGFRYDAMLSFGG